MDVDITIKAEVLVAFGARNMEAGLASCKISDFRDLCNTNNAALYNAETQNQEKEKSYFQLMDDYMKKATATQMIRCNEMSLTILLLTEFEFRSFKWNYILEHQIIKVNSMDVIYDN